MRHFQLWSALFLFRMHLTVHSTSFTLVLFQPKEWIHKRLWIFIKTSVSIVLCHVNYDHAVHSMLVFIFTCGSKLTNPIFTRRGFSDHLVVEFSPYTIKDNLSYLDIV